jgi:hypothetical protein
VVYFVQRVGERRHPRIVPGCHGSTYFGQTAVEPAPGGNRRGLLIRYRYATVRGTSIRSMSGE